jgi:hypothetical protein
MSFIFLVPHGSVVWLVVSRSREIRLGAPLGLLCQRGWRPIRFHKGPMNILLGYFGQPDKSPIATVSAELRGV